MFLSLKICQEPLVENLLCVAMDEVHWRAKKRYIALVEFMVLPRRDAFIFLSIYKCCLFCLPLPNAHLENAYSFFQIKFSCSFLFEAFHNPLRSEYPLISALTVLWGPGYMVQWSSIVLLIFMNYRQFLLQAGTLLYVLSYLVQSRKYCEYN